MLSGMGLQEERSQVSGSPAADSGKGVVKPKPDRVASAAKRVPWALLSGTLASVALLSGGVVLGWWLGASRDAAVAVPSPSVTIIEVPAAVPPGAVMPDLRGLDSQVALQILSDLGVPTARVKTTIAPAAGPAGRVFTQAPARGSVIPEEVALVVSSAATVPKVVGGGLDEAKRQLSLLGAEVAIARIYRPGTAPGSVLAAEPPEGSVLPQRVSLTVADASTSVFLVNVRTNAGSYSRADASLGGREYANSATWALPKEGRKVMWVIGKHVDGLSAMVGVPDSGRPGDKIEVSVIADGKAIATVIAAFGEPAPLFATLTGVTQVEILAKPLTSGGPDETKVVLGEGRFIGGPDLARRLGSQP